MVKKINLKLGKEKNIYFIGDFHIGTKNFDKAALKYTIKLIKEDKNARVVIMGDVIEAILSQDKRFDLENVDLENPTAERQYHSIKKLLMPLKGKVIAVVEGNHDQTLKKLTSFDIPHLLSHDLGAEYLGSSGIIEFDNNTRIFVTHGSGSSTSLSGQINSIMKLANAFKVRPDIVAMGHTHALQVLNCASLFSNFESNIDLFCLTGSYYRTYIQGEDNYATRRNFSPLPVGCVKATVKKNGQMSARTLIM